MKQSSYDEYEEVESPFVNRAADKSPRDRLRTRKNVFNRPFATASTSAPLVLETPSKRKSFAHPDMTDLTGHRKSDLSSTEIDYLDDEYEEEREPKPARRSITAAKKNVKTKKNVLTKIGWSVIGLLVLRLIFMDRGVWDYFATENTIKKKQQEYKALKAENKSLRAEISRIQLDKNYQRQLAKEHLGVIAVDEFLVLFAGEPSDTSSATGNSHF